jgi:DNA ligase (NAD+)
MSSAQLHAAKIPRKTSAHGNRLGRLSEASARRRTAQLPREINRNDRLYYVQDAPVISDAEYDELKWQLIAIEEQFPQLRTPDSPTQRVGGAPKQGLATIPHETSMLSIQSIWTEGDFRHFYESCCEELAAKGAVRGS